MNTLEHQPVKVPAMEGNWATERGAPLTLFGIPDEAERTTHFAIKIPKLASLVLTHDLDGKIKGLNEFKGSHPPVAPVFYAFRVMVGVGIVDAAGHLCWRAQVHGRASQRARARSTARCRARQGRGLT
jgi:cytochrome d ubiquinol oxidase subunit I